MAEEIIENFDTGDNESSSGIYDTDAIAEQLMSDGITDDDGEGAAEGNSVDDDNAPKEEAASDQLPEIPMPSGWNEEIWGAMTPQARTAVDEAVRSHASEIARERQVQQEIRQQSEQFTMQANAQIQQALTTMKSVVEGEFNNIDWSALANQDPARYVQLQQAYQARMSAIQNIQRGITDQVQRMNAIKAQQAQQAIIAEKEAVLPEVQALIGNSFEQKQFVRDVASYMAQQGFPNEAINGISKGYELKTVVKAMKYDQLMAARASASRKVADAPKIQSPSAATNGDGDRASKARAILSKNPDSTDALADYLYSTM